jgi:hypothetical protein
MSVLTYVAKEEIETPRAAAQFRPWVNDKIKTISVTKQGRRAARSWVGEAFRSGKRKKQSGTIWDTHEIDE